MHIDEFARQNMKDKLPELIISEDLFKDDRERAKFSATKGGMFRCPICGAKLALYRPKSGRYNPWNINGFGRCPHFGRDGQYHGDTVGLYAAIHGVDEGDAFIQLAQDMGQLPKRPGRWMRERQKGIAVESEKSEARNHDNAAHCLLAASWGDSMAPAGKALMEKRGIALERLPEGVRTRIGYVDDDRFTNQQGGHYKLSGIAFSLGAGGDLSVQIRCARGGRFITKEDRFSRFISFGEARPFNAEALLTSGILFITEGPFDALSMIQCGADAVASIGAGNHGYIQEAIFRNPNRPVVFIAYDDDEAGQTGAGSLQNSLEMIPGVSVFRFPASGMAHDFNDMLIQDRNQAKERIALARGLALCLKEGMLDDVIIREEICSIRKHDAAGDGAEFVSKSLKKLRIFYRGASGCTAGA